MNITGFGISLMLNEEKVVGAIHRFKIYDRGQHQLLEPKQRKKNYNFQIDGACEHEKIVVRLFLNDNSEVIRGVYFHLRNMDRELAFYLVKCLLQKLEPKFSFSSDFKLKEISKW